jgi:hypothetical protein
MAAALSFLNDRRIGHPAATDDETAAAKPRPFLKPAMRTPVRGTSLCRRWHISAHRVIVALGILPQPTMKRPRPSRTASLLVIPAQAGIHFALGDRVRGNTIPTQPSP